MLAALALLVASQPAILVQRSAGLLYDDLPQPLGGYTQRSDAKSLPGGDRLMARCLVLSQGTERVALVALDQLTVPESLVREVRQRLPKDLNLWLIATHTHSAPDSQMLNDRMTFKLPGIATYWRAWLMETADRVAGVVRAALDAPGRGASMQTKSVWLGLNRPRRLGGMPDQRGFALLDGPPLLYAYAAHAVIYGSEELHFRGDWPGALSDALDGALVVPGAIGDVSPAIDGGTSEDRVRRFVKTTTDALASAPKMALEGQLSTATEVIPAMERVLHPEFAKRYGLPEAIAKELLGKFAPPAGEVQVLRIGKLAIVGIPGEPTSHLGRMVRDAGQRLGFRWVIVLSHVNGWMGYLLDPIDYDRGGYEATLSFHGPDGGRHIAESAIRALQKLASLPSKNAASSQ